MMSKKIQVFKEFIESNMGLPEVRALSDSMKKKDDNYRTELARKRVLEKMKNTVASSAKFFRTASSLGSCSGSGSVKNVSTTTSSLQTEEASSIAIGIANPQDTQKSTEESFQKLREERAALGKTRITLPGREFFVNSMSPEEIDAALLSSRDLTKAKSPTRQGAPNHAVSLQQLMSRRLSQADSIRNLHRLNSDEVLSQSSISGSAYHFADGESKEGQDGASTQEKELPEKIIELDREKAYEIFRTFDGASKILKPNRYNDSFSLRYYKCFNPE